MIGCPSFSPSSANVYMEGSRRGVFPTFWLTLTRITSSESSVIPMSASMLTSVEKFKPLLQRIGNASEISFFIFKLILFLLSIHNTYTMKKLLSLFLVITLLACSSDSSSDDDPQQSSCSTPTTLAAANISESSADISWASSETSASYEIQYGVSGFTLGSGQTTASNGTSRTLTNLINLTFKELK